ncbi:hypothetical protein EDE15_2385 [Edaphobacter aggregans]|uniref:Uncharacterized protein n=1 Tax=Edaphobacter aggregans TaxID=570835 RepID=A0A428MJ56_9BACT|nr:hypothetical protein [Edaphobacter aggregans]RSL16859.1 hypothetical protein EDE15_2385 [Edaphobacter aggregans]
MKFYQASSRSRLIQTVIIALLASSATVSFLRNHRWTAVAVVVFAAVQLHTLWNRYWEITPDATLLSRAYGFRLSYPAATVRYAGPVRKAAEYPVSQKDIELELELEGSPIKRYARVANPSDFLEELRHVSPQAQIMKM